MNDYSRSEALAVVEAYIAAMGWRESTFCQQFRLSVPFGGRPGWLARLRKNEVRGKEVARVVEACSLTWPSGAIWPRHVKRPNVITARVRV